MGTIPSSYSGIACIWQRKYQVIYFKYFLNPQGECILFTPDWRVEGGRQFEGTEREVKFQIKEDWTRGCKRKERRISHIQMADLLKKERWSPVRGRFYLFCCVLFLLNVLLKVILSLIFFCMFYLKPHLIGNSHELLSIIDWYLASSWAYPVPLSHTLFFCFL